MSARHRRLSGPRWLRTRRRVLERARWRCERCGAAGRLEGDHKVPLHQGGKPYALDNLQALCRGCHIAKTAAENRRQPTAAEKAWRRAVSELL